MRKHFEKESNIITYESNPNKYKLNIGLLVKYFIYYSME